MGDPYEVVVSVPEDPELTAEEKDALKDSFRTSLLETLQEKGQAGAEVEVQLITGGGGSNS